MGYLNNIQDKIYTIKATKSSKREKFVQFMDVA